MYHKRVELTIFPLPVVTKLKKRREEAQKKSDDTRKPGVSKEEEAEGVKPENASKD